MAIATPSTYVESTAFSDLPLMTVAPTATRAATAPPLDVGSAIPSPSPTPAVEGGIRANHIRIARLAIDLARGVATRFARRRWAR